MLKILGIIPSRYASTRLPAKPLADIDGKSMIQRVYESCVQSQLVKKWVIATDNDEIYNHAKGFGANVEMTSMRHESGTDRCFEVFSKEEYSDYDFCINVQGDEPLIKYQQIDELASQLNEKIQLATLIRKSDNEELIFSNTHVKVVLDYNKNALYFSRQAIPAIKGKAEKEWPIKTLYNLHVGMYAYKKNILQEICNLKMSDLEILEGLEQLRWLENGYKISCFYTSYDTISVDTQEDLEKVILQIKKNNSTHGNN